VKLLLIGGVRDEGDAARLAQLQALAASPELGLPAGAVEFRANISLGELRRALGGAMAGLHTMWNEHFGIGVVEMMAAGAITVAHDSGGPRADIVVPYSGVPTGFLATTPAQYADALEAIFSAVDALVAAAPAGGHRPAEAQSPALLSDRAHSEDDALPAGEQPAPRHSRALGRFDPVATAAAARASVARFSDEEFALGFFAVMVGLLQDGCEDAQARRSVDESASVAALARSLKVE
jgi:glycosyltransferase involved in cell wall biosynthesis